MTGEVRHSPQIALCAEARRKWGQNCPCCGVRMVVPQRLPVGGKHPSDWRTRGHDQPARRRAPGAWRPWIHICQGCNSEQADRRYHIWAFDLSLSGDPRAHRVATVAEFFRALDGSSSGEEA